MAAEGGEGGGIRVSLSVLIVLPADFAGLGRSLLSGLVGESTGGDSAVNFNSAAHNLQEML